MTTVAFTPATSVQAAAGPGVGLWGPMLALAKRELVRFLRQRGRVVGAVATPLLLWVMLGFGLNRAVTLPGQQAATEMEAATSGGYLAYFYPGMITMVVLFTAIFSTISVIEDRKEGFLQAVLVSPSSRLAIVLGKVLGGAAVATAQGVVLLAAWPLVGGWPGDGLLPGVGAMLGAVGCIFVIAAGLTALGLCFAWWMESSGAFHGVMSLIMMPMWLLSGAMFPLATAGGLRYVMYANPLTYGHATFLALLLAPGNGDASGGGLPLALTGPMMVVLAAAVVAAAVWVAKRQESGVR